MKDLRKAGGATRAAAENALQKFVRDSNQPSLKFEPVAGRPGFFKIRATLRYWILLSRREDAEGVYFLVEALAHHDEYRKR